MALVASNECRDCFSVWAHKIAVQGFLNVLYTSDLSLGTCYKKFHNIYMYITYFGRFLEPLSDSGF